MAEGCTCHGSLTMQSGGWNKSCKSRSISVFQYEIVESRKIAVAVCKEECVPDALAYFGNIIDYFEDLEKKKS